MRVAATLALSLLAGGCTTDLCVFGEYGLAECRVVAEHHYASVLTSTGVTLRFHEPGATDATEVEALGLLQETSGLVRARPAGLMDFAISIDPGESGVTQVMVLLENIAPDAVLSLGPAGAEVDLPGVSEVTQRFVYVALDGDVVWLRGRRSCPTAYRIAVGGDIQSNPLQFERILDALRVEADEAEAAGQPLLGLLLLGDLADGPSESEMAYVVTLLAGSPVPVSTTPGNHDVYDDGYAIYNRHFGPGTYAQAVCDTWLTLVDSGTGNLAPSVQARLPELLDHEGFDTLVAGSHYPAWPGRTGNGWGDEDSSWYLLSELVRNEADMVVAGHYHSWEEMEHIAVGDGSLHQIISGTLGAHQGSGMPSYGFTRLVITAGSVDGCFVEVPPEGIEAERGSGLGIRYCP
jgi:hypothetical protein